MSEKILALAVSPHRGYGADDVKNDGTSLGDLLAMIEEAIAEHGEDAIVVTKDDSNRYGAAWGHLDKYQSLEDATPQEEGCPACGETVDYCQGHGASGDPKGHAIIVAHDDGDHDNCHIAAICD